MTSLKFIFRADSSNVGDWWCPPWRYFTFKPAVIGDILDSNFTVTDSDTLVVGGGGLGSEFFQPHLERIKKSEPKSSILWGAGVDVIAQRDAVLQDNTCDLYGTYFDFFDEIGVRVFSNPQRFQYLPCASCMNNLLFKYRDVKPKSRVGIYNHKRLPLFNSNNTVDLAILDNNGNDFEEKLKFLSNFEYIITNTYHGVYWATLLERKVICIPFKSGLFSFKHPPTYCFDGQISDEHFDKAIVHENVLEESREVNVAYYNMVANKYNIV